jgi:phage repressor protein C with HTH and peptisase S24 domain
MCPIIENGDIVLVDRSVSTLDQIVNGRIYAYSEGDRIKVKRLQRRGLDWWSVSENDKETYKIDLGNEVYQIIGRVVWVGHEVR